MLASAEHYNYFRDYDPGIGRYVQSDPIALGAGLNTFSYALSGPLKWTDDYGLDVGPPGTAESFVPIWGSGREAANDFENGRFVWGTVNALLAVSDIALIGTGIKAVCKGAWKGGSHAWRTTKEWYAKTRDLPPNTPVHHWAIEQNSWIGKKVPESIKNQPWNLNPMPGQAFHISVHGKGKNAFGPFDRWWHGTPAWAKLMEADLIGKTMNASGQGNTCDCTY